MEPKQAGRDTGAMATSVGVQMPRLFTLGVIMAVLYLGAAVLIPVAVATLLTFALSPIVSFLRRRGLPRVLAVIFTVTMAFAAIGMFLLIVGSQVVTLAGNIPTYQANIIEKVRSLRDMGAGGGLIDQITQAVERVGAEIANNPEQPANPAAEPAQKPMPVEIVNQYRPLEMLNGIVGPLISPFATAALVIVIVIFMLLEREALRDRFIRLAGYSDLHKTTEALQDAGRRVGTYLLMQLIVNTCYAVPITIGLWLFGIPNPLLWGMLALVLRFVPYVGPIIAMVTPLVVTFAVTPGWAPLLWVIGLFLVMELITNNVLEPWLYGSRTGLSPLAIIVSAVFWSWLWGPIGLVLSTPLTVCLVVLGRHVQQFEFLNVLFGDEPVLEPPARLYQRLLANDPEEGADHAEEFLEDGDLVEFYDEVGIPALVMAEQDRRRGAMSSERIDAVATAALELVADLDEFADEEAEEEDSDDSERRGTNGTARPPAPVLPDGEGHRIICSGGRWAIDNAAAAMTAQIFEVQGAQVLALGYDDFMQSRLAKVDLAGIDCVVLAYLNPASINHARYSVQRIKRARRGVRVGLLMPSQPADMDREQIAKRSNADFVAGTVAEIVKLALTQVAEPVRPALRRKRARVAAKPKAAAPKTVAAKAVAK